MMMQARGKLSSATLALQLQEESVESAIIVVEVLLNLLDASDKNENETRA